MTDDLPARIRDSHQAHQRDADATRFPDSFRDLVVQYAQPLRADGATWARISSVLPISSTTVRKWTLRAEQPTRSVVPVTVVDAAPVVSPPVGGLCLTSPAGFQLSGLSLEQVAQLMEHLR